MSVEELIQQQGTTMLRMLGVARRAAARPWVMAVPRQYALPLYKTYSTVPSKACAACGATNDAAALQCGACHALQPVPSEVDYFSILGVPRSSVPGNGWKVDPKELKAQWRKQMAVTHPDRLVARPDKEQQIGAQQSAIVNKAYETLVRPLDRAIYLLEIAGAGDVEEGASLEDPELLMEVLELQEALSEAEDRATVEEVGVQNEAHLTRVLGELDGAFEATPLDTDRIKNLAVQLRYWTNIAKAVQEWQPGQRVELHH